MYTRAPQGSYVPQYTPDEIDPNFALNIANSKQKRYDKTLMAASDNFVNFEHYPEGPQAEMAQQIREKYNQQQEKIIDNLLETKDTSSAARDIINLRRHYDSDEDIKFLERSNQQYLQDLDNINKKTTQGGTALMQSENLRRAHKNMTVKNPETGFYSEIPHGVAGDLPSMSELAPKLQKYLEPDSGIFKDENGNPLKISEVKTENGVFMGYNMQSGTWQELSPERMKKGIMALVNSDPALSSYKPLIEATYGDPNAWENYIGDLISYAEMGAYSNQDLKNQFLSAGESSENSNPPPVKPEEYLNPTYTYRGNTLNKVPENSSNYQMALDESKSFVQDSPIIEGIPDEQLAASLNNAYLQTNSFGTPPLFDQGKLMIPDSSGTLIPAFSENPNGKLNLYPEENLFSPSDIKKLEQKLQMGEITEEELVAAQAFNENIRERNFRGLQYNQNVERYNRLRREAFTNNGKNTLSAEQFETYEQVNKLLKQGKFDEADSLMDNHPDIFKEKNLKQSGGMSLISIRNLERGILTPQFKGERNEEIISRVEKDLIPAIEKRLSGTNITPEELFTLEKGIAKYHSLGTEQASEEYLTEQKENTLTPLGKKANIAASVMAPAVFLLPLLTNIVNDDFSPEKAQKLTEVYQDPKFQQERLKIMQNAARGLSNEYIVERVKDLKIKDKIKAGQDYLDQKVQEDFQRQVANMPIISYQGRMQDKDFNTDMIEYGRENAYGTNSLIIAEDNIKERIEGKDDSGLPADLSFFDSAQGIYDISGDGSEISDQLFLQDGEFTLVDKNKTKDPSAVTSKIQKFKFKGEAYLPEIGAGAIVDVYQNTSGDPEKPKYETTRTLFVHQQDIANLYIDHVIKQNPGKVNMDDQEYVRNVMSSMTEAIGRSPNNRLLNVPMPDYTNMETGESTRLSLDIVPDPQNPLAFKTLVKRWDPDINQFVPLKVSSGTLEDIAVSMTGLLKTQR